MRSQHSSGKYEPVESETINCCGDLREEVLFLFIGWKSREWCEWFRRPQGQPSGDELGF